MALRIYFTMLDQQDIYIHSSSDGEKFPNIMHSDFFPLKIPDLQAEYSKVKSFKSWVPKAYRNLCFSFKHYFSTSTKELFLTSASPIHVLGQKYEPPQKKNYRALKKNLESIVWVSYRCNFRPMHGTNENFTSDSGWGCTIRVGQMLLMNCLKRHFCFSKAECYELVKTIEENLVTAPFSIHSMLEKAEKSPGDWQSPSAVSHMLDQVLRFFPIPLFKSVVFMDSFIFKDTLYSLACDLPIEIFRNHCFCPAVALHQKCHQCHKSKSEFAWKNSVLLMLPVMLGISKINAEYYESLQFLLSLSSSVGIIGGKPNSALYLIGFKDHKILVLDPHYVQNANRNITDLKKNFETYFTKNPQLVDIKQLESSMSLGFYFRNEEDFCEFEAKLLQHHDIVKGLVNVKSLTPDYILFDIDMPEENEEGFVVL